jgi:hypothetical protein
MGVSEGTPSGTALELRSYPIISIIYAPRFQRPFEKMAAWSQGHECFKRAWHPLRWQIPLRNTRCEEFPAHRRHTVEVEGKDMAGVLPQGTGLPDVLCQ